MAKLQWVGNEPLDSEEASLWISAFGDLGPAIERQRQKAKAAEAPVEIMIIRNAGHNWRKVGADIEPSRDAIIDRTVQFFVEQN